MLFTHYSDFRFAVFGGIETFVVYGRPGDTHYVSYCTPLIYGWPNVFYQLHNLFF